MQQLKVAPTSDSLNVIMELLGIKFNSLYMPLLNDDEVTFILDFVYVVMTVILKSSTFPKLSPLLGLSEFWHCKPT